MKQVKFLVFEYIILTCLFGRLSSQTSGVLFISGDVHFGEISRFDCGLTYPVYDITSSGLTEAVEEKYAFPFSIALALGGWVLPQTMRVHNSRCTTNTCVYGNISSTQICYFIQFMG